MKPVQIPRRIDDPPHILMWSADELIPMAVGLSFGMMIGKATICFLVGYMFTRYYRRYRDSHPDGYFLHLLFWVGIIKKMTAKTMKNPYIRRFYP
jgi:conjugal transfer pilus assembly protein TraL